VRSDVDAAVQAGAAFTAALPVTGQADAIWCEDRLYQPLQALAQASGKALPEDCVERTVQRLTGLAEAGLPTVFEHGDLSDPNLLVRQDGALQVLDWERADEHGLPGNDLVQFLTYVADARLGARTTEERLAAFVRAWVEPAGWARPLLAEHLRGRGLDPALGPALILSCWARTSVSLVPRVLGGQTLGTGEASVLTPIVASEPDVARWLLCLDRFAEL
jgi:hypothetical protein